MGYCARGGLAGCIAPLHNHQPTTTHIFKPSIDELATAYLGNQIFVQGVATEQEAIHIAKDTKIVGYTIGAGYYPKRGDNGIMTQYAINDPSQGAGTVKNTRLSDPADALLIRKADTDNLCVLTVFNTVSSCKRGIHKITNWVKISDKNFRQVLIYNGKVGNKINIAYQEFHDNSNRPSVHSNVEYDLSQINQIGYKEALVEVVSADNQRIQYRVIRGFINQ